MGRWEVSMGSCGWLAQSVKHLILGFSSGHDLRVMRLSAALGFKLSMKPAWDFLSLCPFPPF